MQKSLKISVLIATYNRAEMLPKAIQSVMQQTYENIEIIISDDCSEDETESIMQSLVLQDPRIRYFRNQKNLGAVVNSKKMLNYATGDVVQYLCDDDALTDFDYFSDAAKMFEQESEVLMVNAASRTINTFDDTEVEYKLGLPTGIYEGRKILLERKGIFLTFNTVLIKKSIIKPIYNACAPDNLAVDLEIVLLAYAMGKIGYIDRIVGYWLYHQGGGGHLVMTSNPKAAMSSIDGYWKTWLYGSMHWTSDEVNIFTQSFLEPKLHDVGLDYLISGITIEEFLADLKLRDPALYEFARKTFIRKLEASPENKPVLFGLGHIGQKVYKIAEKFSIPLYGCVDDNDETMKHLDCKRIKTNQLQSDMLVIICITDYGLFEIIRQKVIDQTGITPDSVVWYLDWIVNLK